MSYLCSNLRLMYIFTKVQMKQIFLFCLLLLFSVSALTAQIYNKNCIYGITFEFSKNPSWGFGELVITEVEPNSGAALAGIQVGDIIMEINGKATYLRDNQTIAEWLFDEFDPQVRFTIRNVSTYFKEYTIDRKCININAISEKSLSEIYSFYSLEDTNHQKFSLPLTLTPNKDVNYTDYASYDFSQARSDNPQLDDSINAIIDKELQRRGMIRNTTNPDIIVQPYYFYYQNPKYSKADTLNLATVSWRFDTQSQKMVKVPALGKVANGETTQAKSIVELGITFYDRKYIDSTKMTQIWECTIRDYLSEDYPLLKYVSLHSPLLLKQYPYSVSKAEYGYDVQFNKYNYTGIYFDSNDLTVIRDVVPDSPAIKAGIREGYIIKKINGKEIKYTWDSLSEGYKIFIKETMKYRDNSTRFTNAEGYPDCMFWKTDSYKQIAKEFDKTVYQSLFSYLYDFRPYVNNKNNGQIVFEIWDGMQSRIFNITPEIRQSVIIKAL